MKSLEQVQRQIQLTQDQIQQQLQRANCIADKFIDPIHGRRKVTLTFRLDELSVETLEDAVKEIKRLHATYMEQRSQEHDLIEENLKDRPANPWGMRSLM